jgi:superfamily II DNA or RNA helicase
MLRVYVEKALDETDRARQLPTGSGKTLVGLLLGEWRRRKFGERVVYLCTTRQLVHQVAEQSRAKYGLKVHAFVGKKADFPPALKGSV